MAQNFPSNPIVGNSYTVNNESWTYDGSGWTRATTATADAILPAQTGNSGRYLTTDGTSASWGIGTAGYTGSTGAGYTGSRGTDGVVGYNGSVGYTGSTGGVGYNGSTGGVGYTGSVGSNGSNGYTGSVGGVGYNGSTGGVGYTGSVGSNGSNGYTGSVGGQLYVMNNPGGAFVYTVDGFTGNYPTLTVIRGELIYFDLQNITSGHPLAFRLASGDTSAVPGMVNNNPAAGNYATTTLVAYRVPYDAPSQIVYQCIYHSSMIGYINVQDKKGFTGSAGAGGSPGGSNTQVQYNNGGVFAGNANLTFNGTGITVGNVNVNSATAPTNGIFLNSTASSGLSFKNAGASGNGGTIIQTYYGMANIGASTNSVPNSPIQFFGFGNDVAPQISSSTAAGNPSYYFTGNGHSLIDQPAVMYIHGGSRGDNTDYTAPEENGVLFVNHTGARGGNVARGKNGIFVKNSSPGLYGAKNGIKVVSDSYQSEIHGVYSLVRPSDPNGGGAPAAFYAQTDNSNTIYDNCTPICVYMDNAPSDNFAKNNGSGPLMISLDRRSGATSYQAVRFCRNSAGNIVGTITTTSSATAYSTSSDYRLKDNPQPLSGSGTFIDALQPKTWTWKIDGRRGVGFIAHEVQEVSPDSVHGAKDAVDNQDNPVIQAMEYGSAEFIANIVAELQSLRTRVAELESKLT
jgi:hypothetical protein